MTQLTYCPLCRTVYFGVVSCAKHALTTARTLPLPQTEPTHAATRQPRPEGNDGAADDHQTPDPSLQAG